MNSEKHTTKFSKPTIDETQLETGSRYSKAPYFQEKDKKAMEFLKKHPIPEKFFK